LVTGRFWPVSDHRAIADEPLFHTSVCSAISRAPLKCVIRLSHSTDSATNADGLARRS
jgi:hypothetical protein